ncbi:MAG: DNA polymerase III subunit gamma/tau [Clostridia bacterium]|nr:DNA polymerase III subunit gamma/tau [Clostridia bacterium]
MEYQALYRQFRPSVFGDMVGQEHIVAALVNQIKTGKLAHAYLFCGTRGTGKTTTARILSRAVNCENLQGADPCNECETCRSIINGSSVDVIEIDAASNTGVDNIRQIREEVAYPPVLAEYKVYIIDEVHMLSEGAFNALLKTLEEPPEHVIFILATTEYHKIPATILSRCQRFDFRRITSKEIQERLKYVCDSSQTEIDDDALSVISYAADGSMRDGLSILDKCISFTNERITSQEVSKILGIVDDNAMFQVAECVAHKDLEKLIEIVENAVSEGRDPILFTSYLIEHFRCLMVASLVKEPNDILQMSDERTKKFSSQASQFTTQRIIDLLKNLNSIYKQQKESPNPKVMLEIGLAELCSDEIVKVEQPVIRQPAPVYRAPEAVQTYVEPEIPIPDQAPPEPEEEVMASVSKRPTGGIVDSWGMVLDELKRTGKMMLAMGVTMAYPMEKGDKLEVVFKTQNSAQMKLIDKPENQKALEDAFYEVTGRNISVKFVEEGRKEVPNAERQGNVMDLAKQFPDIVSVDESEE